MVMPLYFTRHARNRMRQYRITRVEVESVLEAPDLVEPDEDDRLNATKVLPDKVIRVTYVEEATRIVVITVTPRRRIDAGHRNGVQL